MRSVFPVSTAVRADEGVTRVEVVGIMKSSSSLSSSSVVGLVTSSMIFYLVDTVQRPNTDNRKPGYARLYCNTNFQGYEVPEKKKSHISY